MFILVLPYQGSWIGFRPYNPSSTYALFKLHFHNLDLNRNDSTILNRTHQRPVVFCDNIYLSLGSSSVISSILPIETI
ncbi:unnamed protein product [Adineta ricciae]|uniref:Uncharacterized protein n=1 Tax=Adineta ricciae TaxID=249248 RepID=A0A816GYI7_ADIRI|nr:unnamed protein product [Adineta ricciae]